MNLKQITEVRMILPSVLDVFKIGIGPSSSHTLGALKSGLFFRNRISGCDLTDSSVEVEFCGSFALTGKGHLTDIAVVCGLNGFDVEKEGERFLEIYKNITDRGYIDINGFKIPFKPDKNIIWNKSFKNLSHPNTVRYRLIKNGNVIDKQEYHSIGGGMLEKETTDRNINKKARDFKDLNEIIAFCKKNSMDFVKFSNFFEKETYFNGKEQINEQLKKRWRIMKQRIEKGLKTKGTLPGVLKLQRRAARMFDEYVKNIRLWRMLSEEVTLTSIYAIAVAEENADGALIITSPTSGSSGVLPAVLRTIQEKYRFGDDKIIDAMKVAGLIGSVVIKNGSIAGAKVGCQGEIGVACSMAAASACYLMDGTMEQIEFAAEIGLEHHLGLTCDPVAGLVQIPCIERNGAAAVSALNAANLALLSRAKHQISFDNAVKTMMEIGKDMNKKYKETSLGGLAGIYKNG